MQRTLKEQVLSEENIYNAIYAVESYVSERNLLSTNDLELFLKLKDKFDFEGTIINIIKECKDILTRLFENKNELLEVNVYFKIKKLSSGNNPTIEYRPLHSASIINQICMASMLMPLMFDDSNGKRKLSELSRMFPHNFYGNIPSCNMGNIFMNWTEKYREYSKIVTDRCRLYSKTREYDKEISFDLKDFFPSINPRKILKFIMNAVSMKYKNEDREYLQTIVTKLLYFKIPEDNLKGWKDVYYKDKVKYDKIKPVNGYYLTRGIAQGLPQSYLFGNLCMIEIAEIMKQTSNLTDSDAYFYVDDSVVFAKNILISDFDNIINSLNSGVKKLSEDKNWEYIPLLDDEFYKMASKLKYDIEFHKSGKSSICEIEDSFKGMDDLLSLQRNISMGGWIKGNIDEVDDNVALKKLNALQKVVHNEIRKVISLRATKGSNYGEERLKWLRRYNRYFLFRQKRLQIILNGECDEEMKNDYFTTFKFNDVIDNKLTPEKIKELFETFEEEIFKSESELIINDLPLSNKIPFCKKLQEYEQALSKLNTNNERPSDYLYYHRISSTLCHIDNRPINDYESLFRLIRRIRPLRNSEQFITQFNNTYFETDNINKLSPFVLLATASYSNKNRDIDIDNLFPQWCEFVFKNSSNFKRKILNCSFSYVCNILPSDNLNILRSDIKPTKYYELRVLSMLRNSHLNISNFLDFVRSIDPSDLNERMEIDLGILEGLGIFRQKIQDPNKIDRLIQTHRLVKSLWHNGSKFLNAYTLHNHEHAINLIKNVIRLVNNVDFLNLKSNDFFLLFNVCYLHDISMVIHPNVSSFNISSKKSEHLISKWLKNITDLNRDINNVYTSDEISPIDVYKLRKKIGLSLIEAFQDIFEFFENTVREPHAHESANYIRNWQKGILSFLTELEADTIATISDSHGWETSDVYEIKSSAKEELISVKYMMILIRLADLLDLANDRIDYYLLKQNRSQMSSVSRYHWISHLITDKYELDVDYETYDMKDVSEQPIHELIHLDIFLNTEILVNMNLNKGQCIGITSKYSQHTKKKIPVDDTIYDCLEFLVGLGDKPCNSNLCHHDRNSRRCPFLCTWMSNRHWWLLSELGKLKHYLNSVNSKLISSDITVRFFYDNRNKLDSEFFDDVKNHLIN